LFGPSLTGPKVKIGSTGTLIFAGTILLSGMLIFLLTRPQESQVAVQDLIKQEEFLNDKCRDGRADTEAAFAATQRTCDQRNRLVANLKALGWCYGTDQQFEYEKKWQLCEQRATPKPQEETADKIEFNQIDADNNVIVSKMEASTAACAGDVVRGLLRQGIRSRSELLHSVAGICGLGLRRFLSMKKVPDAAADKFVESILAETLDDVLR